MASGLVIAALIAIPWLLAQAVFGGGEELVERRVTFLPAGWAFAIWTPIYLGFLAFAVFQAIPSQRENPRLAKARPWVLASAALNAAWLLSVWAERYALTVPIIALMLVVSLRVHEALEIRTSSVSGVERWIRAGFSLYAGWLTVATVANVSSVLARYGWEGFGWSNTLWGALMVVVATAIGLLARHALHDRIYGAVFIWAFIAIAVRQWEHALVAVTALLCAALFCASLFVRLPSRARRRHALA